MRRSGLGNDTIGLADSTRWNGRGVGRFGLDLEKFRGLSKRNTKSDPGSGTRRDPIGITTARNVAIWGIILGGLSCVGCSSFLLHF